LLLHTSRFPSCYDDISGLYPKSRTTRQFSEIFKRAFDLDDGITSVTIANCKEEVDVYGKSEYRMLSVSRTDRETYKEINWPNFSHHNLDKVTPFEFYGSSVRKSLRDLRDILKGFTWFVGNVIPCNSLLKKMPGNQPTQPKTARSANP